LQQIAAVLSLNTHRGGRERDGSRGWRKRGVYVCVQTEKEMGPQRRDKSGLLGLLMTAIK